MQLASPFIHGSPLFQGLVPELGFFYGQVFILRFKSELSSTRKWFLNFSLLPFQCFLKTFAEFMDWNFLPPSLILHNVTFQNSIHALTGILCVRLFGGWPKPHILLKLTFIQLTISEALCSKKYCVNLSPLLALLLHVGFRWCSSKNVPEVGPWWLTSTSKPAKSPHLHKPSSKTTTPRVSHGLPRYASTLGPGKARKGWPSFVRLH